jgi:CheY-like chemotaxis protein
VEAHRDEWDVLVHFAVSDTGIGVPAEWQGRIFDAFVQADGSHTRRHGGTGLGLSICSRMVGFMGGCMWIESQPGKGSTFHFTANLGIPASPTATASAPEPEFLAGLNVLVVDDNATNRRILQGTLLRWRMKPVLASGGPEALDILRRHARSGDRFALALLDAHMPDMDGFALARQIRDDPALAGPPVMMLSSLDMGSIGPDLRETGHYLVKPVTRGNLLTAILRVLGGGPPKPAPAPPPLRTTTERPLHILVADDNAVNRKVAARLLEKHGHSVVLSSDGAEALIALAGDTFDLVLMDVQMPVMDGYATTQAIRAAERGTTRHIPIVALTAHAMKGDREVCLQAGMDDYLGKPIRSQELEAVLLRLGRPRSNPTAPSPSEAVEELTPPGLSTS